jgi:hypothetical protein
MTKQITLTLDDYETEAMAGWDALMTASPQYIGVPPPPNPNPPPYTWQPKIVLSNTSRMRYEEIHAQFAPTPPVGVKLIDVAWGDGQRFLTKNIVPFGCNVIAMRFTVPATPATYNKPGYFSIAENEGPPTLREVSLSVNPGDFDTFVLARSFGVQATIDFNVGAGPGSWGLAPGLTYYINMRNWDQVNQKCSCDQATCNAGFSTNWPMNQ